MTQKTGRSIALNTTVESSAGVITNLQLMNVGNAFMQMLDSRVNSRGAASNTRRPSHSIWSPASSKRPVLTKLGSPESNKRPSIVSRHTANSHLEEPNLTDAINCQTIPKLVQEMQARRDEKGVGTNSSSRRAEGTPTNSNL